MIFDWSGLKENTHFVLSQVSDPLKYCNYAIPIPMSIGLPFMPCDLPNEYQLYSTDSTYELQGDIYLNFEESVTFWQRFLLPASHRPWSIIGKDYYNHIPYAGIRQSNFCCSLSSRPTVKVYYQQRYVGKIVERTVFNCCCITQIFQQFVIYNEAHQIIYKVISKNPQRGHFLILPWCGFDKIKYQIVKITEKKKLQTENNSLQEQEQDSHCQGQVVGQVVHLFNGFAEYTSKNDKYGISLPLHSSEEQKCLLIYCVLLIDYLLFQNF